MLGKKDFVGITIRDDEIRVARLRVNGKTPTLVKLDTHALVEKIKSGMAAGQLEGGKSAFGTEENTGADEVFGFEEETAAGDSGEDAELEDLDFGDLDDLDLDDDGDDFGDGLEDDAFDGETSLDMVDESESSDSNELLLYNILTDIDPNKVHLGLNIPSGHTMFQVLREADYNDVKKKALVEDVEDKLRSIYGAEPSVDYYSFQVREDGSLLLGAIDEESVSLQLINRALEFYNGKVIVNEIIPDEVALVGLVRANYELQDDEMSAVIQFGKQNCRIVFMKGEEIWQISPLISEGTESNSFLNTIFSKILFQLDTGEVPSLDRIIIADNTIGESALEFFSENFPDVRVENFSLLPELIDAQNVDPKTVPAFTTAIGTALAASQKEAKHYPDLSFVPEYVYDRQKLFRLQWHGVVMLFMIFLTPIVLNYFYNHNVEQIDSLSGSISKVDAQIQSVDPIVDNYNEVEENLAALKEKLVLLNELSEGTQEWSVKFNILNRGVESVGNSWITSMGQANGGTVIEGYSLYRERIPQLVNIFSDATLLSVNTEEEREETEIYHYRILIKEFAGSVDAYSPEQPEEVKSIIEE